MSTPWWEAVQIWPAAAGSLPLSKSCGHKHKSLEAALRCIATAGSPRCGFLLEVRTHTGEVVFRLPEPAYHESTGTEGEVGWWLRQWHTPQTLRDGRFFVQEWGFTVRGRLFMRYCQPAKTTEALMRVERVGAAKIRGAAWLLAMQLREPGYWSEKLVMAEEIPAVSTSEAEEPEPTPRFGKPPVGEA